jgi:hypothetical protein
VALSSSFYLFVFHRLESIHRSNLLLQSLGRNFSLSAEDAERARNIRTGLQYLHQGFSNLNSVHLIRLYPILVSTLFHHSAAK